MTSVDFSRADARALVQMFRTRSGWTYVAPHIAIGGVDSYEMPLKQFDFMLNVARELVPGERYHDPADFGQHLPRVHHIGLADDYNVQVQVPAILRAVKLVREARLRGESVLVNCAQGRNRSALVVAEYLCQEASIDVTNPGRHVVAQIQARRPNSLTNTAFVRWLNRK